MTEQSLCEKGNWLAVYKTLFLDLPLVGVRQVLETGKGKEAAEAVWKNYDEGVRLATVAIDNLYRDPRFGEVVDRALQEMLRWQRWSNAVSGAFFSRLWPPSDLPTATEVRELVRALRAFSEHRAQMQVNGAIAGRLSNLPREELRAPVRHSSGQREHEQLTMDLLDYFEPVDWKATVAASAAKRTPASSTDFSEYFEPVDYPAVPSRNTKLQKHASHIHHIKAKTQAVKHPQPQQHIAATPAGAAAANADHTVPDPFLDKPRTAVR